mgnify:CR=1 FL=1
MSSHLIAGNGRPRGAPGLFRYRVFKVFQQKAAQVFPRNGRVLFPFFVHSPHPGTYNLYGTRRDPNRWIVRKRSKQRIPGLGNGVLQDILWAARIHPKRRMDALSGADMTAMFDAVKRLLAEMTARGGRDTERDLFGAPGGYVTVLSRNTVGAPCPACGATIAKEAYLGGAIYYCPGCQAL